MKNLGYPVLIELGLNENEALIYELLLTQGACEARELVVPAGIGRGNVYNVLTSLEKKGLILTVQGTKTRYQAADPGKLNGLLERKIQQVSLLQSAFQQALASMVSAFQLSTGKPTIQMFEGKNGIIAVYEEVLRLSDQEILSIEDKGEMARFIPEYFPKFIRARVRKRVFNRVIAPSTNPINQTSSAELRETRNVSVEALPFAMDIKIFSSGVSLVTFQDEKAIGMLLHHTMIAANFRLLFEYLWQTVKPPASMPHPTPASALARPSDLLRPNSPNSAGS